MKYHLSQERKNLLQRKVILSPKLTLALRILSLPALELKSFLEEEIEKNPLLEKIELPTDQVIFKEEKTEEIDFSKNPFQYLSKSNTLEFSALDRVASQKSLYDHLFFQSKVIFKNNKDLMIAKYIIGSLNSSGFLDIPLEEITSKFNISHQMVERVLKTLQSFDPVGIASTSLQECLINQLINQNKENSLAYKILKDHFNNLLEDNLDIISKKFKVPLNKLKETLKKELKNLTFSPAENFINDFPNSTIIPDVIIGYDEKRWMITINDKMVPKFVLSSKYQEIFDDLKEEEKKFINKHIDQGRWLQKAINIRKEHLKKIVLYIINKQKNYILKTGPLIPLNYKEVADFLSLNSSTIYRAVSKKYVALPDRIISMNYFFSRSIDSINEEKTSKEYALNILKKLIENEDKKKPFSDSMLCKKMSNLGIFLARRTISKYRKKMKIEPARKRKFY